MSANGSGRGLALLVGFQDQDNLGLRYLMSSAKGAGFEARIVTYDSDAAALVELARRERPVLIGFSLIFQYMAPDFARVIGAIRNAGVAAHITMGGHYPSFDYGEVLERMPGLDSVVRYEGEATFVELLERVAGGECWEGVEGLAYRREGKPVANRLRASVADLDTLPWPSREDIDYESREVPVASVLGSRGCPWDCSFCSIRPFYEAQEGPLRRLRSPEAVVEEMAWLHEERGVPLFLFQDDDFLAGGARARQWACAIAEGLARRGLADRVAFKMSCRSDEVREDCLATMMAGGLTHVYMGVENGDPRGLLNMSKRIVPEQHLEAGRVLKRLGLSFDFGFMLLDPYSDMAMVRTNIEFLETFVGDGWSAATFCRMLPYAGTPVKARLEAEGRLLGTAFEPDYRFLDPKLDVFYDWMLRTFHERNFTNRGLCHVLKSLLFEANLRLEGARKFTEVERTYARYLTARCNGMAFNALRAALEHIESASLAELERGGGFLEGLTFEEAEEERSLMGQVVEFYGGIRSRGNRRVRPQMGAFEKSWTHAETVGS